MSFALYEAWVRKNGDAARAWLNGASGPFVDAFHAKKVEAALALLDGDPERAHAAADAGTTLLAKARLVVTAADHEFFDSIRSAVAQQSGDRTLPERG